MHSDPDNHPILSYSDSAAEVLQFLKPMRRENEKAPVSFKVATRLSYFLNKLVYECFTQSHKTKQVFFFKLQQEDYSKPV